MLAPIVQSLPIAIGILLSSTPLVAITLTLYTRGRKAAVWAFILGWVGSMALIGGAVLVMADTPGSGPGLPSGWVNGTRIVLGLLLLYLALKQWRGRPQPGTEAPPPKWMRLLEGISTAKAGGLGLALVALNPKNLLLTLSGAVAMVDASPAPVAQWAALAVFTTVASLGIASPVLAALVLGPRVVPALDGAKAWIVANNAAIMTTVLLLLGLVVLGNGLSAL